MHWLTEVEDSYCRWMDHHIEKTWMSCIWNSKQKETTNSHQYKEWFMWPAKPEIAAAVVLPNSPLSLRWQYLSKVWIQEDGDANHLFHSFIMNIYIAPIETTTQKFSWHQYGWKGQFEVSIKNCLKEKETKAGYPLTCPGIHLSGGHLSVVSGFTCPGVQLSGVQLSGVQLSGGSLIRGFTCPYFCLL